MSKEPFAPGTLEFSLHRVLDVSAVELRNAILRFPPFRSVHEAESVLRQEMDELTRAVRRGYRPVYPRDATPEMTDEAVHLAAMALRFLIDCPSVPPRPDDLPYQ